MRLSIRALVAIVPILLLTSCGPAPVPDAPVAEVRATELSGPAGATRTDEYYWLRERENPEVIAYLEAENAYMKVRMAHTAELQETVFEEIRGRIKEDDSSVPYRKGDWWYYTRYEIGGDYPLYCRRQGSMDAEEQVMLDGNALAEGHDFFSMRQSVSPSADLVAYAVDTVGRRKYTLRVRNLTTGEDLTDVIPDITGSVAWANDNRTFFYVRQDPETLRWYQIWRHSLGTDASEDVLVYEETDDTFSTYVGRTKSDRYLMISANQTLASEYRYLDADDPMGTFTLITPRERGHEYSVDHFGDQFYFRTNSGDASNFRLASAPVGPSDPSTWTEVIAHRPDVYLGGFEIFRDQLVVSERSEGLTQLRVMPWNGSAEHYLDFGEPAYLAYISTNLEFDTTILRYGYTSMTTPSSTFDYDMVTRDRTLLKQEEVLGDFDSANYRTERLMAPARDGVLVPVSLVYRIDMKTEAGNPLLQYAYGSYGSSSDATFSSARLSLLDRGFVYALAHIRGGQEMGRSWYEDGKLLKKMNTFTDFVDVADFLATEGYADPARMYAQGGSAGGLLMGVVLNIAPERFHGVIAAVPFVDVITTMPDDTIPLTTSEYDEWGNPNDPVYYEYMLSYSPYDNVEAKAYPNVLVTTGLHDSQVQYWEPAKWVARLRAKKTDDNMLIMKTNMEAGHGGASARFERYRQTAFQYAFIIDLAGV